MAWSDEARARSIAVRRAKALAKKRAKAFGSISKVKPASHGKNVNANADWLRGYQNYITSSPNRVRTLQGPGYTGGSGGKVYSGMTARQGRSLSQAGPMDYGKRFKNSRQAGRWARKQIKANIKKARSKESSGREMFPEERDMRFMKSYKKLKSKKGFRVHAAKVRMRTIKTKAERRLPRKVRSPYYSWQAKRSARKRNRRRKK
jgi:hypothetical protein